MTWTGNRRAGACAAAPQGRDPGLVKREDAECRVPPPPAQRNRDAGRRPGLLEVDENAVGRARAP